MILGSTGLFMIAVLFFLFAVHRLVGQEGRLWTQALSGTAQREGAGGVFHTLIAVEAVGNVAVRVRLPDEPRYDSGAPVVVHVPTFFTPDQKVFEEFLGLEDNGFVQISFLLPGKRDRQTDFASDGILDYGGPRSVAALRAIFLYAAGKQVDVDGKFLQDRTTVDVDMDIVGAYAFSHSGILLFQTLAHDGDVLPVDFVVARENPTEPLLSSLELGHMVLGKEVLNTQYVPAVHYRDDGIVLSYADVRWDTQDERPYFDVNDDGRLRAEDDVVFGPQVPGMFGKRVYSPELLVALHKNELFTTAQWPTRLATPEEASAWWKERESLTAFSVVAARMPRLPVMLVFAQKDHAQPSTDKPHIRQAYAGLAGRGLWVRLNPDASYVGALDARLADSYEEHSAGTGPMSWEDEAVAWGHPNGASAARTVPFAAIAEMADRVKYRVWSNDLSAVLSPL